MIYLIAGHDKIRTGAVAHDGTTEHFWTTALQQIIIENNRQLKIITDDESFNLRQVIQWINKYLTVKDVVLDIHFNNNNPLATGTEIFIHEFAQDKTRLLATEIVNNLSEIIQIPVRRYIQQRDYKYPKESHVGTLGIIERAIVESDIPPMVMLLEVCFLNKNDMEKYIVKQHEVARSIIRLLSQYTLIGNLNPKDSKKV